jgi:hypothetical protein
MEEKYIESSKRMIKKMRAKKEEKNRKRDEK